MFGRTVRASAAAVMRVAMPERPGMGRGTGNLKRGLPSTGTSTRRFVGGGDSKRE